jgi:hypothetical protein
MGSSIKLIFQEGQTAKAARVHRAEDLYIAFQELGLRRSVPTLGLVGGASGLDEADVDRLFPIFVEVLAPLAEDLGAAIVDGGTDTGVMRLMGQARHVTGASFPLIGVAAAGTVVLPGAYSSPPDAAPLEPHHTHFVLVPGSEWGDESPWLPRVASVLANGKPSATLLVNGGETAWEDVARSVETGRPVIVIAGSGRTAEVLAAALRGEAADERGEK